MRALYIGGFILVRFMKEKRERKIVSRIVCQEQDWKLPTDRVSKKQKSELFDTPSLEY